MCCLDLIQWLQFVRIQTVKDASNRWFKRSRYHPSFTSTASSVDDAAALLIYSFYRPFREWSSKRLVSSKWLAILSILDKEMGIFSSSVLLEYEISSVSLLLIIYSYKKSLITNALHCNNIIEWRVHVHWSILPTTWFA